MGLLFSVVVFLFLPMMEINPFVFLLIACAAMLAGGAIYKYYIRPRRMQQALRRHVLERAAHVRDQGGSFLPHHMVRFLQRLCLEHAGTVHDPLPGLPLLNQVGRYSDDDALEEEMATRGRERGVEDDDEEGSSSRNHGEWQRSPGSTRDAEDGPTSHGGGESAQEGPPHRRRPPHPSRSSRALRNGTRHASDASPSTAPIGGDTEEERGSSRSTREEEVVENGGGGEEGPRAGQDMGERGNGRNRRSPAPPPPVVVEGGGETRRTRRPARPRLVDFPRALPPALSDSGFHTGSPLRVQEVEEEYFLTHLDNILTYRDAEGYERTLLQSMPPPSFLRQVPSPTSPLADTAASAGVGSTDGAGGASATHLTGNSNPWHSSDPEAQPPSDNPRDAHPSASPTSAPPARSEGEGGATTSFSSPPPDGRQPHSPTTSGPGPLSPRRVVVHLRSPSDVYGTASYMMNPSYMSHSTGGAQGGIHDRASGAGDVLAQFSTTLKTTPQQGGCRATTHAKKNVAASNAFSSPSEGGHPVAVHFWNSNDS